MELKHCNITDALAPKGRVRLYGDVSYDTKGMKPEVYWFETSEKYAEYLTTSGNPWITLLLPLAVTLGEPLRISQPVDRDLYRNVHELMRIWKSWYPELHIVPIEAEVATSQQVIKGERAGAFFTGGIDSLFTILYHQANSSSASGVHIDECLYVFGYDVMLENTEAFVRIRESLQRAAADLGKVFIDLAANIRTTAWGQTNWALLSHSCALGGVAHALERRYGKILIGSSESYRNLVPWGSHPLTDSLLSTSHTTIIHDGAGFDRVEKTEFVAGSDVAKRCLRVCWKSRSGDNCCACSKCYRTMATLDVLGVLDHFSTFRRARYESERMANVYCDNNYIAPFRELQEWAIRKGRDDVARAVERGISHSQRLDKWLPKIRKIDRWLANSPVLWRYGGRLERALFSKLIM